MTKTLHNLLKHDALGAPFIWAPDLLGRPSDIGGPKGLVNRMGKYVDKISDKVYMQA